MHPKHSPYFQLACHFLHLRRGLLHTKHLNCHVKRSDTPCITDRCKTLSSIRGNETMTWASDSKKRSPINTKSVGSFCQMSLDFICARFGLCFFSATSGPHHRHRQVSQPLHFAHRAFRLPRASNVLSPMVCLTAMQKAAVHLTHAFNGALILNLSLFKPFSDREAKGCGLKR